MPYIGNVSGFDDVDTEQIKDGAVSDVKISDVDHSKVTGLGAEISTAVSNLVDSSPASLDTLNELAAALGDDPNFATTVTNSIALKAPIASPNFTGTVTADGLTVEGSAGILLDSPDQAFLKLDRGATGNYGITRYYTAGVEDWHTGTRASSSDYIVYDATNSVARLKVNTTGIDVTGTVTADTLIQVDAVGGLDAVLNLKALEASGAESIIKFSDSVDGVGAITYAHNDGGSDFMRFVTASVERMRIDSSGNVGIGSSSIDNHGGYSRVLEITGPTEAAIELQAGAHYSYLAQNGTTLQIKNNASSGVTTFADAVSERMRIDSAGRVLIGKTSTSVGSAGVELQSGTGANAAIIGTASVQPMILNRLSTDGALAQFRKDGTTVGSIRSDSGSIMLGSGDVGVYFDAGSDRIIPMNITTGSVRNDAIDIGGNPHRFKDLYLSGGVYLGGVGASNKLDDYEEGSFDLGVTVGTIGSSSKGKYIKIGSQVTVFCQVDGGTNYSDSALLYLTGLPFTSISPNTTGHAGNGAVSYTGNMGGDVISAVAESNSTKVFFSEQNSQSTTYSKCTGIWAVRFTVTYQTNS
jgi:hypothetical protein